MQDLKAFMVDHPFLRGLKPHHLEIIVGCASNVRFDTGEFVFREGEDAKQFYLIRHGKIALEVFAAERGHITIQTLTEGEILGWSWLIPPHSWQFDARAMEMTRAIALDGTCLRTKCESDYELGYELLKRFSYIVSQRLESTRLQLLDVYGNG